MASPTTTFLGTSDGIQEQPQTSQDPYGHYARGMFKPLQMVLFTQILQSVFCCKIKTLDSIFHRLLCITTNT